MFFLIQQKKNQLLRFGYSRKKQNHLTTCISFNTMRIPDFIKHSVHVSSKLFFILFQILIIINNVYFLLNKLNKNTT